MAKWCPAILLLMLAFLGGCSGDPQRVRKYVEHNDAIVSEATQWGSEFVLLGKAMLLSPGSGDVSAAARQLQEKLKNLHSQLGQLRSRLDKLDAPPAAAALQSAETRWLAELDAALSLYEEMTRDIAEQGQAASERVKEKSQKLRARLEEASKAAREAADERNKLGAENGIKSRGPLDRRSAL